MQGSTKVPIAPFRRVLVEWIDAQGEDFDVAVLGRITGLSDRLIYRILHEEGQIEWSTADTLVARLDPWLWIEDEELAEVYANVDLAKLDLISPLDNPVAQAWARGTFQEAYERTGSMAKVAAELEVSVSTVHKAFREMREAA